jgi:hypothetical protein
MDTVGQLNLKRFKVSYRGNGEDGNVPYVPKLYNDIAFRILRAGNFPWYRTIARFRSENLDAFSDVFTQVVTIA